VGQSTTHIAVITRHVWNVVAPAIVDPIIVVQPRVIVVVVIVVGMRPCARAAGNRLPRAPAARRRRPLRPRKELLLR
jgi:hypothetical protein